MPHEGWSWKRVTADTEIYSGPCVFAGVILAADGVGTADVTIRDGRDTGGRQFATFRTPVSRTESHVLPAPAHFDGGIFVDVGSNVEEAVVLYQGVGQ